MPTDSSRLKLEPLALPPRCVAMNNHHGSREGLMMIAGAITLALAIFLGSFAVNALMLTSEPAVRAVATR